MSVSRTPMRVADLELSIALPEVTSPDVCVRYVVRLHGHPLGVVDARAAIARDELGALIWSSLDGSIRNHFARWHRQSADCSWRTATASPAPAAAIVINSCAASERLERTIRSALGEDYPDFTVTVVDNRPAASGLAAFLETAFRGEPRLRYAAESLPGLGRARNAGLHATAAEIVAFTDDDVVLDPAWLGWLVAGFSAADNVACVTGLIVPLELETPGQMLMEDYSGFGKGFEQRIWDRDEHRLSHPLYPYTVGLFGSGASAAFRRGPLLALGGFDPHLGIGTPAIGGEDIDVYTRLILAGHRIVYQPTSLLRHLHRREMRAADRQIQGYGAGLTAMLTKHLVTGGETRRAVLRRIPAGLRYALSPQSPKNARKPPEFSMRQSLLEWAGMAYGPIGYFRSRLAG